MIYEMAIAQWWNQLDGVHQLFYGIAIVATVLFLIQFVLSIIGVGIDSEVDFHTGDSLDADASFDTEIQLFSVRSIVAFFTFFGWTGVIVLNNTGKVWVATIFACLAGVAAMATVAYIMYLLYKLEYTGNVHLEQAIGSTGEVYIRIPEKKNGMGKVHINVQGSLREVDAWTEGKELPTGTKIKIINLINKQQVLVTPAEDL